MDLDYFFSAVNNFLFLIFNVGEIGMTRKIAEEFNSGEEVFFAWATFFVKLLEYFPVTLKNEVKRLF